MRSNHWRAIVRSRGALITFEFNSDTFYIREALNMVQKIAMNGTGWNATVESISGPSPVEVDEDNILYYADYSSE